MKAFVIGFFLFVFATSCNKTDDSKARGITGSGTAVVVYGSQAEFPPCDATTARTIVFSEADNSFFICDGSQYKVTSVAGGAGTSTAGGDKNSGGADETKGISLNCPGVVEKTPDPEGVFGQYQVNVPENVDPCTVKGYVVGQQSNLTVGTARDGTYYFNNVPAGSNDLIITAGTIAIDGLALAGPANDDRGIRVNNAQAITGLVTKLGKINLPKNGSISGTARLNSDSATDHAGILVYVPGTGYSALTDKAGKFKIEKVPSGTHNLYFEKDGFARGQIEGLNVKSEEPTVVPETGLYLDTGEYGSFSVLNSFKVGNQLYVPNLGVDLAILPSAGASLMMVSFSDIEGRWLPVTTNLKLTRDIDKMLEDYYAPYKYPGNNYTPPDYITSPVWASIKARFANANGLESDTIEKNVMIDYFSDGTAPFAPKYDMELKDNPLRVEVKNIVHPAKGENIAVSISTTPENTPVFGPLVSLKSIPVKDKIQTCGKITATVIYKGFSGKIASPQWYGGDDQKSVNNSCHTMIPATTTISPATGDWKHEQYFTAWTGNDLFVFGYDDEKAFTGSSYNPATGEWGLAIDPTGAPVFRKNPQVFVTTQNIYVYGGYGDDNNYLFDLYVFDIATRTWKSDPATQQPTLSWGDVLVTNGSTIVYLVGRNVYNEVTFENDNKMMFQIYSPGSHSWSAEAEVAGLPYRTEFTARPYGSEIVIIGGRDDINTSTATVFKYDPVSGSVVSMTPMVANFSNYWASEIYYDSEDGDIYLGKRYSNTMYKYTSTTSSWTSHTIKQNINEPTKVLRTGSEFSWLNYWGTDMTIINLSNQEANGRFSGNVYDWNDPAAARWSNFQGGLVTAVIKGYGLFTWGGKYSYYEPNAQQPTNVTVTDGAIVRTAYKDLWTP